MDNPITWEYLVDAMSKYLANLGSPPAASVDVEPPAIDDDAPAPAPSAIDNVPAAAATVFFYQPSLSDFWFSS